VGEYVTAGNLLPKLTIVDSELFLFYFYPVFTFTFFLTYSSSAVRVLFIASRFPHPLDKGDKLRLFHQARCLAPYAQLDLFCLADSDVSKSDLAEVEPFFQNIFVWRQSFGDIATGVISGFFSGLPVSVSYFSNKRAYRDLQRIFREEPYDLVYCQLIRMAPYLASCPIPRVIDFMDAFSLSYALRSKYSTNRFSMVFFKWESKRMSAYEKQVLHSFEGSCAISPRDAVQISMPIDPTHVVVPNGVDYAYFSPHLPFERQREYDLVFVGNMGYFPNQQAALYLVKQVLPLLLTDFPDIRILIAGARPGKEVLALQSGHVVVSDWMDDIRFAYQQAHVFVAPLFSGAGQQNKMLEAMAMGVPCITSSHVNVSLGAVPGEQIMLAENPAEFASVIADLLNSPQKRESISLAARTFAIQNFDWIKSNHTLLQLFENVLNYTKTTK
jgi:polysaccharide biosynthesis protein PslH